MIICQAIRVVFNFIDKPIFFRSAADFARNSLPLRNGLALLMQTGPLKSRSAEFDVDKVGALTTSDMV